MSSPKQFVHPAVNAIALPARLPTDIESLKGACTELQRDLAGVSAQAARLRKHNATLVAAIVALNNASLLDGTSTAKYMAPARDAAFRALTEVKKS